jgi:hypothetical protein
MEKLIHPFRRSAARGFSHLERFAELSELERMAAGLNRFGALDPASRGFSGRTDPTSEAMRLLAADNLRFEQRFRSPLADEIGKFAMQTSLGELGRYVQQENALAGLMARVQSPWLEREAEWASAKAFAELSAIVAGILGGASFDPAFAAALRPALGDWRDVDFPVNERLLDVELRTAFYADVGLDRQLATFTPEAFDEVLDVAGLAADEGNEGLERAQAAFAQLQHFEVRVRKFISHLMERTFGPDWMKHRLPAHMYESWNDRREADLRAGNAELPLIAYADFTDYKAIIEKRDNWREVFRHIFSRAEDVRESFQRLFPVRLATMHARIISLDDELLLRVETRRLMRAMEKAS